MKYFFHLLILAYFIEPNISLSWAETNASQTGDFHTFWVDFRFAVINNHKDRMAQLTYFPFKTRGTMDSDPLIKHDKKWFLKSYEQLLAIDPGLSSESSTMRTLIEQTPRITSKEAMVGDQARIGDFVFEKIKGKWYFTFAYFDDE